MYTNKRTGRTIVQAEGLPPDEKTRLVRLARELRLTDQILSDVDELHVLDKTAAPAATSLDGSIITLGLNHLPKLRSREGLATWLGVNVHELGHVKYTPRLGTALCQRIEAAVTGAYPKMWELHNIVEDPREERLMIRTFSPWEGYLVTALGQVLVDTDELWLLVAGRPHLGPKVLSRARERFEKVYGPQVAGEVRRLVVEYTGIVDPGQTEDDWAWAVLTELYDLLRQEMGDGKITGGCGVKIIQAGVAEDGEPLDPGEGQGDPGDDEGEGDDEGDGFGAGTLDSDLAARRRELLKRDDTAVDLDRVKNTVNGDRGGDDVTGNEWPVTWTEPTEEARLAADQVTEALRELKEEAEPGWLKRTDSGRLNVRRYVADPNPDFDSMFDRFEPGMLDATTLEVVLLVDVSSSMDNRTETLGQATWAMRQAVEAIDGRMTVLTYNTTYGILARPDDAVEPRVKVPVATGGTTPDTALVEAARMLASADAANRLLVTFTDGAWMTQGAQGLIEGMNEDGVKTVMVLLGLVASRTYGFQHYEKISGLMELPLVFRRVAVEAISDTMAAW